MNGSYVRLRKVAFAFLLVGLAPLAAAGGVFVRDVGAGVGTQGSGPILPLERTTQLFNAFELTYTLAVFSTVRVDILVEAPFSDWKVEFGESVGSFVETFRPPSPGIHLIVITNLEAREGQLGVSLEQHSDYPPEFEYSLLVPLASIAAVLFTATGVLHALTQILERKLVRSSQPP